MRCSRSAIWSWWAGGSMATQRRESVLKPWLNIEGHLYHTTLPRRPVNPPWKTVKESMGKTHLSPPQCLQDLCTTAVAIYLIHFSKSTLCLHFFKHFPAVLPSFTSPLSKHIYKKSQIRNTSAHWKRHTTTRMRRAHDSCFNSSAIYKEKNVLISRRCNQVPRII